MHVVKSFLLDNSSEIYIYYGEWGCFFYLSYLFLSREFMVEELKARSCI